LALEKFRLVIVSSLLTRMQMRSLCTSLIRSLIPALKAVTVKHNSGKHAKADMIGVRALFTIECSNNNTPAPKTKALPSHFCLHLLLERTITLLEMAQTQSRKRKSDLLDEQDHDLQTSTPTGGPARKRAKITRSQKQALIDNLQLESELPRCGEGYLSHMVTMQLPNALVTCVPITPFSPQTFDLGSKDVSIAFQ
jgi:hypothetical protein